MMEGKIQGCKIEEEVWQDIGKSNAENASSIWLVFQRQLSASPRERQ